MPNKDTVVAVISDMQVGSTVALCPLKWSKMEGGSHRASPGQRIIHREWIHSATKVNECLNEHKERKRLVLVVNGEPIDGDHHATPQLITTIKSQQLAMSESLLDEWLNHVGYNDKHGDKIYLVRGTTAHERGEHINELGRDIDGVVPYRKDTSEILRDGRYYWQILKRRVNGVYFRITHHGFGRGSRAWTTENSIQYALKSYYFKCLDEGKPIPEYMITSHKHVYNEAHYFGRQKTMFGCTTPCWQLPTHFVYKVASLEDLSTIGMIYVDVTANGGSKLYKEFIEVENTKIGEF